MRRPPETRQERWRHRNPLKAWSHAATRSAVRHGLLSKPGVCACGCGESGPLEAHHPDHRDPLSVVWMRKRCHLRLHAEMRQAARRAADAIISAKTVRPGARRRSEAGPARQAPAAGPLDEQSPL